MMISITLDEFTSIVGRVENANPPDDGALGSKKSNGMSLALGKYLDSLSEESVLDSEINRLSDEFSKQLNK